MRNYPSPHADAVTLLAHELTRLRRRNPCYSLRAFAKRAGVSPSTLSEILRRKRSLTLKSAAKIGQRIFSELAEQRVFLSACSGAPGAPGADAAPVPAIREPDYAELLPEVFAVIENPAHYYLLALMRTDDFRSDPRWIARRLRLTVFEVRTLLTRLQMVGLVHKRDGAFARTGAQLATTQDVPSAALRRSHRQTILEAASALEDVPVEMREISSTTLVLDPRRLPEAKALIRKFRRELAELMECGERTEVYNLNTQLVPVTRKGSR